MSGTLIVFNLGVSKCKARLKVLAFDKHFVAYLTRKLHRVKKCLMVQGIHNTSFFA